MNCWQIPPVNSLLPIVLPGDKRIRDHPDRVGRQMMTQPAVNQAVRRGEELVKRHPFKLMA